MESAAPAGARRVTSCVVAVMCHPPVVAVMCHRVLRRCHVVVAVILAFCPPLPGICQIFPTLPPSAPYGVGNNIISLRGPKPLSAGATAEFKC